MAEEKINDEIAVGLLADLQEKQHSENSAMNSILGEKVSCSVSVSSVTHAPCNSEI